MNAATIIEKGKRSWQAAQTRMTALPAEWRAPLVLAICLILAILLWTATRRSSASFGRATSPAWKTRSSIASTAGDGALTKLTTPPSKIDFDARFMREDGGEVFWDLTAMYGPERNTLHQVNMALDDLMLRVDTLERKRTDE